MRIFICNAGTVPVSSLVDNADVMRVSGVLAKSFSQMSVSFGPER